MIVWPYVPYKNRLYTGYRFYPLDLLRFKFSINLSFLLHSLIFLQKLRLQLKSCKVIDLPGNVLV